MQSGMHVFASAATHGGAMHNACTQVEYQFGTQTYELLKQVGANVILKTYEGMRHAVSAQQSDGSDRLLLTAICKHWSVHPHVALLLLTR